MPVPAVTNTDLTTFSISIDDQPLDASFRLEGLSVSHRAGRVSQMQLRLIDGNPADQDFPLASDDKVVPGAEIELQLGYSNDESSVFKGVIVKQTIQVSGKGIACLLLECRHRAFLLTVNEHSRCDIELSDSDLISQRLDGVGIDHQVEASSVIHPQLLQYRCSDWQFITQRARLAGLVLIADGGGLRVEPPTVEPAQFSAHYGVNVIAMQLGLDGRQQLADYQLSGWSSGDQSLSEVSAAPLAGHGEPGNLSCSELAQTHTEQSMSRALQGDHNNEALQQMVDAEAQWRRLAKIQGWIDVSGAAELQPNRWVRLQGFGDRYNGEAWLSGVEHRLINGSWISRLYIGYSLDEVPLTVSPQPQLLLGKVVALSGDPANADRIQVQLAALDSALQPLWCRLASLDAGADRGFVWRPEVDDEVLVNFIGESGPTPQPITSPVIIGSVYSAHNSAPLTADDDDNHKKGWKSRAGIEFVFDDEAVSLRIETPAGNSLLIDDDSGVIKLSDQHDNSLTLDSNGISLQAASDIALKASAKLEGQAGEVSLKSDMSLSLQGGSSAELSSSGNTDVQGAIVNIN